MLNYIVDFSEADFAEELVKEINGEREIKIDVITDVQLAKIADSRKIGKKVVLAQMLIDGLVDTDKKIITGKLNELLQKYPELQSSKTNSKVKDRNKDKNEKVTINKEVYDKIKDLWMLLNQKYTLQYDDEIDKKIDVALPEIVSQSLTDITISSVRSEIRANEGQMIVGNGSSVPYVIKKKMKYNDFLKRINKATNISITKIHKAFCEANKRNTIDPDKINEKTAS